MTLLIIFAFIAGIATALSPCVLPVLPIVLSVGVTGGRRRPLGIAIGVAGAFTLATIALVYVIAALGLPNNLLRTMAIAVLLVFGVSLLVPVLSARIEALLSRIAVRAPAGGRDSGGFWSGLVLGGGLGLVYAPCAGPILAGVITVSASQPLTAGRIAVALAYGVGSAVSLYGLMLGGRRVMAPLARRSGRFQMVAGAMMVVVAVAMAGELDIRFQTAIATSLPAVLVNPSKTLEESVGARKALADLRGDRQSAEQAGSREAERGARLPDLGPAPEFVRTQRWFNTRGGRPLTLAGLRGRVVLIDFWTYTCINCLRTLPYLRGWDARYRDAGLTIVGVHTPEFPFEKSADNVRAAIKQNKLRYAVAQDNEYGTWDAYANQYWPAKYLIDARGRVRYVHFGEGEYDTTEKAIRALLAEAGGEQGSGSASPKAPAGAEQAPTYSTTPESYLGAARARSFVNGEISVGRHDFGRSRRPLKADQLRYSGRWRISDDAAGPTAAGARLDLRFHARRVFLVLGSRGGARTAGVLLDGRPVPDTLAGPDVAAGRATIDAQRLYRLIDLPRAETHTLTIVPEPGVLGYAFTFG